MTAIIDFEFTGLDNSFITDNEIIQVKICNFDRSDFGGSPKWILRNFNSKKNLSAHTQLEHQVLKYEAHPFFTLDEFVDMLSKVGLSIDADFFGFGVEMDKKMLAKYDIELEIKDIRTHFQKSKFAYRMATEGSGLEETFLIVTGLYPPDTSHADLTELMVVSELYKKMKDTEADEFISIVPFGHCAGMPISEYVIDYRRNADGYRYNNNDEFAKALTHEIEDFDYGEWD